MNKTIEILDTTLRDGSYAINFKFTTNDTRTICQKLDAAGLKYIEIGHGLGLGATRKGHNPAIHSDEEYLKAAADGCKNAKFGMFCIPGIADVADIDLAASYKMGFVRVGTDVTHVKASQPFIERAKKHGMFVAANYMKSYVSSPEEFAENVKLSESYGADMVYIVDSSGGMFSEQVRGYFEAIRAVSNIKLGFHGHDNLGMAIANSVQAAELGIEFIDGSLQGLGRSSGNAATELLMAALLKKGYQLDFDLVEIISIGQQYVRPMITRRGHRPLDIVAGYADFHTSFMHQIEKYSALHEVNPAKLIIEYTKHDKISMNINRLEEIATQLKKDQALYSQKYEFRDYFGHEQDSL